MREVVMTVRFTKAEYAMLVRLGTKAKAASISAFIRGRVLDKSVAVVAAGMAGTAGSRQ